MPTALRSPGRQGLRAEALGQVCICGSALVSMLIAAAVLTGWALDSPALKAVLPGAVQMKPNTALALLLAAAALWMLRSLGSSAPHRTFRLAQALGLIVVLIGLLTLGEYLFGWRLHIDQLLFADRAVAFNKIPGRMSPYSAFAFVAIGSMLTALPRRPLRAVVLLGIILTMMIGVLSSLGYVWRASELTTDQWLPPVAVNTGVTFMLLAAGALALSRAAARHSPVDLRAAPRMQAKVLLGFGVTMALLVLGGGITYRMQARFEASVQVFTHAEQLRSALGDVYASMAAAELAARHPAQSSGARAAPLGDDRTVLQRLATLRAALSPADRQLIDIDEIEYIVNSRLAVLHGGALTPERAALAGPAALDALRTQIERFDRTESDLRDLRTLELARDRSFTLISLLLTLGFAGATLLTLYASIVRDVRERASIIAALEAAKGEAQRATQAKSEFLAAMSHEIRTPMNAVLGLTEVLQQSSLTGRQLELVTLIRESGDGLLAIIDDILDFSKIEAGRLALERLPMCVADVVENTCGLLNRLAERKGVSLSMHVDPAIPATLLGDPTRLRQILINLIGNAIKFSAGLARPGRVDVRAQLSGGDPEQAVVQFSVADNGIGIEASTLTRLFQSFTQADSSTTRLYGGTGLGLTISNRLAVLAGGDIGVTTAVNEGSTFMLRLPFPRTSGEVTPERPLEGLRCVLLPRSTGLLKDLASYLIAAGASVEYSGQEGEQEGSDPAASKPAIWVAEASPQPRDSTVSLLALRGMQRPRAMVLVVTGRRPDRRPEAEAEGVVVIDGNALSRQALIDAVLRAAGRARRPLAPEANGLRPRARSLAPPLTREEARRRRRLILVAEDNPVNQQVIRQQLDLLGHTADIAPTGRQALERWRSGDYALVLADLHMPELDGYGLTLAIRMQEAGQARTPIIALTANALNREAERCLGAGMDGYLTKPASLQHLADELQRWLPQDSADSAASPLPASPPHAPIVPGALEALVGHDPQLLAGLLSQFLDSAEHQTQAIVAAASAERWTEVAQHAHSLKSSARAVGAHALGELCAGLEQACLSGAAGGLAEQLTQLQAEMATVAAHLRSTPCEYQADPVPLGRAAEA